MVLRLALPSLILVATLRGEPGLQPVVEIEEDVYSYQGANNGAGPMWCGGSTCLVRTGDRVFATGLETIPDAKPLNNCRWVLFERRGGRWERIHEDKERTREPSPLAAFHDGRVIVSANPTIAEPDAYSGPSRPELWDFAPDGGASRSHPRWQGSPTFSEHSYRTLAADGARGELMLFQNIGYAHAEWAFRDAEGTWSTQGRIRWPHGEEYEPPRPVRLCYPNVALQNRAVHFFAVGDITEPDESWRRHKEKLTGRKWDYVFRRLYYSWSPDITKEPFRPWTEVANREATAGHIRANDLWVDDRGSVHLLWTERAIDERLREQFFPEAEQSWRLNYAVVEEGEVLLRRSLLQSTEKKPGLIVSLARFHVAPDGRVFIVMHVAGEEGGEAVNENRIVELGEGGELGVMRALPLKHPIANFFTATPRAGSPPSKFLDLLGLSSGEPNVLRYVRVRLERF